MLPINCNKSIGIKSLPIMLHNKPMFGYAPALVGINAFWLVNKNINNVIVFRGKFRSLIRRI